MPLAEHMRAHTILMRASLFSASASASGRAYRLCLNLRTFASRTPPGIAAEFDTDGVSSREVLPARRHRRPLMPDWRLDGAFSFR